MQPVSPSVAGETALIAALREERWEIADLLMARYGASVACRAEPSGETPLHVLAAMNSDASLAALQVPSYLPTYLPTFLTYGCSLPHLRLQGAMLYGGLALLNARNAYAHTPLHVAVSHGATRAARCLIEHGANPTLRFDGFSARDVARDDGDAALVRLLRGAEAAWARRRAAGCEDDEDEGADVEAEGEK